MNPLWISVALILLGPADESRKFAAEQAAAANDPNALVQLALCAESKGMKAERDQLLRSAVAIDPHNAMARGLLGEILLDGMWQTPEKVAESAASNPDLAAKMADYNARRARVVDLAQEELRRVRSFREDGKYVEAGLFQAYADRKLAPGHVELALWCEKNGLKAEALAHFTTAVRLDPHRDVAWKHLGYVKHEGRWMTPAQVRDAQQETALQKKADATWEPTLRRLKASLSVKNRQATAEAELARVDDVRAVPMIAKVFFTDNLSDQKWAVRLLDKLPSPASTRDLAVLAVRSIHKQVRIDAIEALKTRQPVDYAEMLVDLVRKPWVFRFEPVGGPGSTGRLVVDSPRFQLTRTYDAPAAFTLNISFYGYVGLDPNGLPVVIRGRDLMQMTPKNYQMKLADAEEKTAQMLMDAQVKAQAAQGRMIADVQYVESMNAQADDDNRAVREVLQQVLAAPDLGDDEDAWHSWLSEKNGYRYTPPPKMQVSESLQTLPAPSVYSCFAAGTPVRTLTGRRPIESLNVGDQVLCQDTSTGQLGFEPILVVHHNPPDKTVRVILDNGDEVVASLFHRFWLAGRGWAMAKDLRAGDVVRTLTGRSSILKVEPGAVMPVFNLDVARGRTFFVGIHDALVHDNTLPDPRATLFDAASK